MPYVGKVARVGFAESLEALGEDIKRCCTAGDLNYLLTSVCLAYTHAPAESLRYQRINDVLGALECAKLEYYRRLGVPYEDKKIAENGDVYP